MVALRAPPARPGPQVLPALLAPLAIPALLEEAARRVSAATR